MQNKTFSVGTLLCLALLAAFFCPGCGSEEPAKPGTDKPDPNAVGTPVAKGVAVTVNGIDILESEVQAILRPSLEELARKTQSMSPADVAGQTEQLRRVTLDRLIRKALLDAQIIQAKIVITDEQVRSRIEQVAAAQEMSVAAFVERLKQNGRTIEGIRREVRTGLARDQFLSSQWEGKIDVTEGDAKEYYEENAEDFKIPEQVMASHILIMAESTGDPDEQKAKARAKAEQLLAQIRDGADFAELAKANSSCPSASNGGNLDYFPRGSMAPAFEKAAFELEVGKISDVVETQFGFHIIKVTDHMDPTVVSFEEARERIMELLTQTKQMEFVNEYLNKLMEEAQVVYPPKT